LPLLASACGGGKKEVETLTCPKVISAPDAARVSLFNPGGDHAARDVSVTARIDTADNKCAREGDHGVTVFTEINFYAERARPTTQSAVVPYFVAVMDPTRNVVAQESFTLNIKFLPAEGYRMLPTEKITTHLPLHSTAAGGSFTLIVGFQLTPEQLAFNRAQHLQ
jgi:hypothetical protein